MKKVCIVTNDRIDIIESISNMFANADITIIPTLDDLTESYDVIALINYFGNVPNEIISNNTVLNIHQSLLPSFDTQEPIKDAYLAGVKVTGVTVYMYTNDTNKILAQYPIMIDAYTHYDELEIEIKQLETKLYPLVIKSMLADKVFDIVELLTPTTEHHCGGCSGCGGCH